MALEHADTKLTMDYRVYFKGRPEFLSWKEEFRIGLIEAKSEDKGQTVT